MPPGTEAEATAACWPENHRRPGGVALRCTKRLLRRPRAVAALGKGGRRGPCDLHAHADAAGRAWGQRRAGHLPAPAAARCLDEREEHRVSTAAAASVVVSSARWAELATAAQRRGGQKPRLSDASHTRVATCRSAGSQQGADGRQIHRRADGRRAACCFRL
ncbi:hypothetical protein FA09DRAFT_54663 [Tilletiopsis washingtonensis]|uniref:Uncharacterized protein n=1 Tax=Tilletiopsis washingtonensis TaxID=58919 RepID=A0A316Z8Y7_9BASI|nr:hypothetical protein FA09DRAFT_54663 [Tilletiopsis washingtonensis]PWN97448.1 hypothetical protein FA09DRAFT_54663 [Tilletiopsis washingtonensis]